MLQQGHSERLAKNLLKKRCKKYIIKRNSSRSFRVDSRVWIVIYDYLRLISK